MEKKLIIDLEMCKIPAKARRKGDKYLFSEIIQIGAAVLDEKNEISDRFNTYVKPQLGEIDEEIQALTRISNEMTAKAPVLVDALSKMSQWMAGRSFRVLSWSETDYYQLLNEMRSKRIRSRMIEKLFENWSDLQKSFSRMIGLSYILSLDRVIEVSDIVMVGSYHDGLYDALNTAAIVQKIQAHPFYELEFEQIEKQEEEVEHLNASLGNFFSADILQQFSLSEREEPEQETQTEVQDLYKDYRIFLFGTDRETGDCWELYDYQQKIRMK